MAYTVKVDIVSAEKEIYSGSAEMIFATGVLGEMCIMPGHLQLLTFLKPGEVRLRVGEDKDEVFYISGGILEVQPLQVTVLAGAAERAADLDEAQAEEAMRRAQQALSDKQADIDYATALSDLAQAAAQLRAIRKIREQ